MVDRNSEENQSHQTTVEQCTTTFQMSDRDSLISFGNLDFVLTHACKGT